MFTPFAFVKTTPTAVAFLPTDIAGLQCWWDAQVGVTLSGTDITKWADQSGNNFIATQSVAIDCPSISSSIAAINGNNAVRFDRANTEYFNIVSTAGASKPWLNPSLDNSYTMFTVINVIDQPTNTWGNLITQGDNNRRSVGWGPQVFPDNFISFGTDNYAAGGFKVSGSGVNNPFTIFCKY